MERCSWIFRLFDKVNYFSGIIHCWVAKSFHHFDIFFIIEGNDISFFMKCFEEALEIVFKKVITSENDHIIVNTILIDDKLYVSDGA